MPEDPTFHLPEAVELRQDIPFATTPQQPLHLDLYLPRSSHGAMPAVVYIHGGGWKGGTRHQFRRHAAAMAERGFAGATIEYRFSQVAHYPAALEDCVAGLTWIQEHAHELAIDLNRLGLAGGSAGGHLASLLGTNRWRVSDELCASTFALPIGAVAAFNPVLDLTDPASNASQIIEEFLGVDYETDPERWRQASPALQVGADGADFLFLHGTHDALIPIAQAESMSAALSTAGVRSELFAAEGAEHGFFNRPPWFEPTLQRMVAFFDDTLGETST
jgi:acetyl esterase/lipase